MGCLANIRRTSTPVMEVEYRHRTSRLDVRHMSAKHSNLLFFFLPQAKQKNETNIKNKLHGFYFPKILVRPNVRISDMTVC